VENNLENQDPRTLKAQGLRSNPFDFEKEVADQWMLLIVGEDYREHPQKRVHHFSLPVSELEEGLEL
jgi:hypothetical protein